MLSFGKFRLNPSLPGGGGLGASRLLKGFSSITFEQNNIETSNFAYCNFNNVHIEGYD